MKQTNITHNIRVDKNKSNRMVFENWDQMCEYLSTNYKEEIHL